MVTLVYMQYEKNVNENEMREQHRGELNNNNKKTDLHIKRTWMSKEKNYQQNSAFYGQFGWNVKVN